MSLFRRRYPMQGAPPGAVAATEQPSKTEISSISFNDHELEEGTWTRLEDVPTEVSSDRVTWIDVRGLGDGSIVERLGEHFQLHPLAISDVINVGQRPKVEHYDNFLFVVVHMVTFDSEGELKWEQVSVVLGDHFVLTFQETPQDCLEPLRLRIRTSRKTVRESGADYLASAVIDAIVDGYFPVLEKFGDRLEEFEELILEERKHGVLGDLYVIKRELGGFRRAVWPLREALSQLMRDDEPRLTDPTQLHMRDTLDHTMQVIEVNETYRELAASLVDVHLSMVGQRTNDIMRVLTVISVIFIPLTFVAGVYGMNFDTSAPLNMPELHWPHGYVFFWFICLIVAAGLLLIFRRLGWLQR